MEPEDFAKLTKEQHKKMRNHLDRIFWRMINRFVEMSDMEKWDQLEHWERPHEIPDTGPLVGDCDCFALACRKRLRQVGYPNRLVYVLARKPKVAGMQEYIGHLVCEVNGWIFDNYGNQGAVIANTELMYEWVSISGYNEGDPWHKIKPNKKLWHWDWIPEKDKPKL